MFILSLEKKLLLFWVEEKLQFWSRSVLFYLVFTKIQMHVLVFQFSKTIFQKTVKSAAIFLNTQDSVEMGLFCLLVSLYSRYLRLSGCEGQAAFIFWQKTRPANNNDQLWMLSMSSPQIFLLLLLLLTRIVVAFLWFCLKAWQSAKTHFPTYLD